MNNDIDARKDKMEKWVTIGSLAVVGLIVSPIIFLTIQGLVGLAIAAAVGFGIVSFTPWFALKVTNAKYRAIDAERVSHLQKVQTAATANPIETMQNMLIQKNKAFVEFRKSVTNAASARDTFKQKCDTFAKKYPARAPEFKKQLDNMVKMVEVKKDALQDAKQMLEAGQLKLEEMQAYWEMSQALQEANQATGMDTGDAFEKLKVDTACDAVFESMNKAFAQLEIAASLEADSDDTTAQPAVQLTHSEPDVLDIPMQVVRETVKRGLR